MTRERDRESSDKSVKQSHYLLAALVHKNNPDKVSNPLDAPAGATKEVMKKKAAEERLVNIAVVTSTQGSTHGKMEESMMSARTSILQIPKFPSDSRREGKHE